MSGGVRLLDTVSYASATSASSANCLLLPRSLRAHPHTDTLLAEFENLIGSAFNDVLTAMRATTVTRRAATIP
jgi:hypothetical protein